MTSNLEYTTEEEVYYSAPSIIRISIIRTSIIRHLDYPDLDYPDLDYLDLKPDQKVAGHLQKVGMSQL